MISVAYEGSFYVRVVGERLHDCKLFVSDYLLESRTLPAAHGSGLFLACFIYGLSSFLVCGVLGAGVCSLEYC